MSDEIYRDEFVLITEANSKKTDVPVAVQVGNPPDESTPTITSAKDVRDSLDEYIAEKEACDTQEVDERIADERRRPSR
jgi:hypothetical protein